MNVDSERHLAAESNLRHVAGGLPHSIEAEQGLLGAILINNEAYSLVSRLIEARDFELEAWLESQPDADPRRTAHGAFKSLRRTGPSHKSLAKEDVMRNL